MNSSLILSCLISFIVTILSIRFLSPIATRLDLVDKPGGRKMHVGNIPLIGGLGLFLGLVYGVLSLKISLAPYRSYLAGAALLIVLGMLDDLHELTPRSRFIGQIASILLMSTWGNLFIQHMGNLGSINNINLGIFAIPFTIIVGVAMINATNMLDGLDGLAGSLSFIIFLFLAFVAYLFQQVGDFHILILLAGITCAFLIFNLPFKFNKSKKVFLGDAGSMFLGFSIFWFIVHLSQNPPQPVSLVLLCWFIVLPILDICSVIVKRILCKQKPVLGNRDHIHHLLLDLGFSTTTTLFILCGLCLLFSLLGLILTKLQVSQSIQFLLQITLLIVYIVGTSIYWRKRMH